MQLRRVGFQVLHRLVEAIGEPDQRDDENHHEQDGQECLPDRMHRHESDGHRQEHAAERKKDEHSGEAGSRPDRMLERR